MLDIDHHILGNGALHQRFCTSVAILAKLVSCAPRAITLQQMEESTGCAVAELEPLCADLAGAGLLRRHERERDSWVLMRRASDATLEDVFRCVVGAQPVPAARLGAERTAPEVDLLVTQATMAINQSVSRHLRQFPLDRLKARPAAPLPAAPRGGTRPGLRYPEAAGNGLVYVGY